MGGKGLRRREKNYREAHGGSSRLPPPPDRSKIDALPASLRKLISFTKPLPSLDSAKDANHAWKKKNIVDGAPQSKSSVKDDFTFDSAAVGDSKATNGFEDLNFELAQFTEGGDGVVQSSEYEHKKKKKKRKRGQVEDLRFAEALKDTSYGAKKREKKKKFLAAKKEKKKKAKTRDDTLDFPRDKVVFGDVVLAPPKLTKVPKASKNIYSASQERIRLKAVDEYRKRRGWNSRPGIHLPTSVTASSDL